MELEVIADWCWEHKLGFGLILGSLAVFGFGAGSFYEAEQKAVQWAAEAAERADENLFEV